MGVQGAITAPGTRGVLGFPLRSINSAHFPHLFLTFLEPPDPCDPQWHGTAAIGIMVGDDGGDNQIGVAPGARFIVAASNWSTVNLLADMEWMLAPTDLGGQNPRPELIGDVAEIRHLLDHSAIDASDLSCGGEPWRNNVWGEGRLDAFDAASLTLEDGFETGDTSDWSATVP